MKGWLHSCGLIAALAAPSAALAQAETTVFCYDAMGRLIRSSSTHSADATTHDYVIDNADNRARQDITDAAVTCADAQALIANEGEPEGGPEPESPGGAPGRRIAGPPGAHI